MSGIFRPLILAALMALAILPPMGPAAAQQSNSGFTVDEIVATGQSFFGNVSTGLATVVERAASSYGLPNGYILGEQGSGAIIGGLRYGQGTLYTRNAGQHTVYWQGPSIGWDFGGEGSRVMMLVYNLPSIGGMYQRFGGVNGSAYLVGGVGMTVLSRGNITVVPIVAGVGARIGINLGYLKFTDRQTWNPF